MSLCMVCDADSAQYHYGGTVCRPCAAFFRRFVNTRKVNIKCNCDVRKENKFPCRLCRMKKCLTVGMKTSKVQGFRDSNNQSVESQMMIEGTSNEDAQIDRGIRLKNWERITGLVKSYKLLELSRKTFFETKNYKSKYVNLYELTIEFKEDTPLLSKFCETSFPEFEKLERAEKDTLFKNFKDKWGCFEMYMNSVRAKNLSQLFFPSGRPIKSISEFYLGDNKNSTLTENDVSRLFEPFWNFYLQSIVSPLADMNFKYVEIMAVFGIILWDAGYSNLTDNLADKCRAMRTIICREISSYLLDNDCSENRFFEILDTLNLIEKAEKKSIEEIQLCEMFDLKMDSTTKDMIMWEKI